MRTGSDDRSSVYEAIMNEELKEQINQARRSFLLRTGMGLGALSLLDLLGGQKTFAQATRANTSSADHGILGAAGHFPAKAKRIIYLHMLGAVSQVDTFDYKPMLVKMNGQEIPKDVLGNRRLSTMTVGQSSFPIIAPLAPFKQHGQSGAWVSDLLPNIATVVDDLCFIKSMYTEHVNHDPASKFLHTGFQLNGRPSIGSWVNYALGSDNDNLPAFLVMTSGGQRGVPLDAATWGAGFIPSHHQGVQLRSGANPVPYVTNPSGVDMKDRRELLDVVGALAKEQNTLSRDPELLSKASQYEMAYRMQTSVPEVADLADEPEHVMELYGPDVRTPGTFARNCLLARRLAERNVKFTLAIHMGWDHHFGIAGLLPGQTREVDQPIAGLLKDLKQRGLLEDTLVVWGSEFGRGSFAQGTLKTNPGRDHHGGNFTWFMAGAGVKAGYSHGESDDFSTNIAKDPVHIHDLNATILHLLGIDHDRLTYKYQGRDFKLTDVAGKVVKQVLA
jgi:hypothetical protein